MCVGEKMPVLRSGYVYVNTEAMKEAFRVIRDECHINDQEISKMSGRSKNYVSGVSRGQQLSTPIKFVNFISKKAGVPYDNLIRKEEETRSENEETEIKASYDIEPFRYVWISKTAMFYPIGASITGIEETDRVWGHMPGEWLTKGLIEQPLMTMVPYGDRLVPLYICKAGSFGDVYFFSDYCIPLDNNFEEVNNNVQRISNV